VSASGWNTLSLSVTDKRIYAFLNGISIVDRDVKAGEIPDNGFIAIGTQDFGMAQFDDFQVIKLS